MRRVRSAWMHVRALLRGRRGEREFEEEMRCHLEHVDEAGRAAAIQFGGLEQIREEIREGSPLRTWSEFERDLRFGWRTLQRAPVFAVAAILTLALGVGLNTAIFGVIEAAILRPLPVPHASQLVFIGQGIAGEQGAAITRDVHNDDTFVSWPEYQHYAAGQSVFNGLAASDDMAGVTLQGSQPREITGSLVSCNYFSVLEVRPARGRGLGAGDCASGAAPVVVVSDLLWREQYGASPKLVGSNITLNRTVFTVVGVAPPRFGGTIAFASDYWVPVTQALAIEPDDNRLADANLSWLAMTGRLRPGVSRGEAAAAMQVLASQLNALQPRRVTTITVVPATLAAMPSQRQPVEIAGTILLVAAGLILLLACANLASLLLARGARRRPEMAMRQALGASRGRLLRQLLTESLLLAVLGGGLGGLIGAMVSGALLRAMVSPLPMGAGMRFALHPSPDGWTWLFALGISVFAVCVFGLAPALRASRPSLIAETRHRLRSTLVGMQVALCMVLLLAAVLMLRALQRTEKLDPGFTVNHIATVSFDLARAGYSPARAQSALLSLQERLKALPGVESVAESSVIPLGDAYDVTGFESPGHHLDHVYYNHVSPELFPLLGLRVEQGRAFTDAEVAAGAPVMMINGAVARSLWPGQSALGKRLHHAKRDWQVVGVVADAQLARLGMPHEPYSFFPASPASAAELQLMIHYRGGETALVQALRTVMAQWDARLPVAITPLAANLDLQRAPAKVVSALGSALGGLALLLALLGIFGMVAYRVEARLPELGIRMALGAERGALLRLVVRQGLGPVLWGLGGGIALGAIVSHLLSAGLLFGLSPWDPVSYLVVPLLLAATAAVASLLAAQRALGRDPLAVLKHE